MLKVRYSVSQLPVLYCITIALVMLSTRSVYFVCAGIIQMQSVYACYVQFVCSHYSSVCVSSICTQVCTALKITTIVLNLYSSNDILHLYKHTPRPCPLFISSLRGGIHLFAARALNLACVTAVSP